MAWLSNRVNPGMWIEWASLDRKGNMKMTLAVIVRRQLYFPPYDTVCNLLFSSCLSSLIDGFRFVPSVGLHACLLVLAFRTSLSGSPRA
jgi:hypothetical protein